MTPTDFREGGGTDAPLCLGECSLGSILIAASEKGVCAILFGDDPDAAARSARPVPAGAADRRRHAFEELAAKVVAFVEAPKTGSTCRSILEAPRSSIASGTRSAASRRAPPRAMRRSPRRSARRERSAPWPGPAPRTASPLPSLATAWCERRRSLGLSRRGRAEARAAREGEQIVSHRAARPVACLSGMSRPRIAADDWERIARDLDAPRLRVIDRLLTPAACEACRRVYDDDGLFRRQVVMAQHGYGRGEYQYFGYPLPPLFAALRRAAYPQLARSPTAGMPRWASTRAFPTTTPPFSAPPCRGPTRPTRSCSAMAPATITACIRISTATTYFRCRPFLLSRPGRGFHRRRVPPHRAAAADAVARRGRAAAVWRRRDLSGPPAAGRGRARHLPRQYAPRRQPAPARRAHHPWHHLPRRQVGRG